MNANQNAIVLAFASIVLKSASLLSEGAVQLISKEITLLQQRKKKNHSIDFSIISNVFQKYILRISYVRQLFLTYMVLTHAALFLNEYLQQVNVL